jgi:hypothetical protein
VGTEMERHEVASQAYEAAGLQILDSRKRLIPRILQRIRTNRRVSSKRSCRTRRSIAEVFLRATLSRSMCLRMGEKLEIGSPHWTISATGSSVLLRDERGDVIASAQFALSRADRQIACLGNEPGSAEQPRGEIVKVTPPRLPLVIGPWRLLVDVCDPGFGQSRVQLPDAFAHAFGLPCPHTEPE